MDRLFLWDDSPEGNVEHIAEHGLTPEEVESAFDSIEPKLPAFDRPACHLWANAA
jgi:hypothetical protein